MSQKNIGMGLIVFGIFVFLFAFSMSVSVEGSNVVNLNMISERQNTITLGGVVFLAGIILFALAKLKQTEAEDEIEKAKQHARSENARKMLDEVKTAGTDFSDKSSVVWSKARSFFMTGNDNVVGRVVVGLFVGSCVWFLSNLVFYVEISWFVFFAFAFAYSMRSIQSSNVILHLLTLNVIAILLSAAFAFTRYNWDRIVIVLSVPLALSCLIIWFINARKRKSA